MVDNPMIINTDWYPHKSKREYLNSLEHQIININESVEVLNNQIEDAEGQITTLLERKSEIEEEMKACTR